MLRHHRQSPFAGSKPAPGTPINWQHPITRGLVADWLLNEGHGRTVHDGVNGYDLIFDAAAGTDPIWQGAPPNVNGEGLTHSFTPVPKFRGSPDRFIAPANYPKLANITKAITVEMWWWQDTNPTAFPIPVIHGPVNAVWSFVYDTNTLRWRIGSAGADAIDTPPNNPAQRWMHHVGTYSNIGASAVQLIYRDGVQRGTGSKAGDIATTTTGVMGIGDGTAGTNYFAGFLGLVRIWERALTPDEIWTLYHEPFAFYGSDHVSPLSASIARKARLPVEWRGPLARAVRLPVEWRGQGRRALLPIEFGQKLVQSRRLPVEWRGFVPLSRRAKLPVEFRSALSLKRMLPFESAGLDPDSLTLIWNVIRQLDQPLLLSWDVVTFAAQFPLEMQWSVIEALASLELRWNDLPDIFTPFGITPPSGVVGVTGSGQLTPGPTDGDIQKPVATLDKTP